MSLSFPSALLSSYEVNAAYDEMLSPELEPRPVYHTLYQRLQSLSADELTQRQLAADQSFLHRGITFSVYGHDEGTEKIFPYDVLPRILSHDEWEHVERGLEQRITALNLFLKDIYGEARILTDQVVPHRLIYSCKH